jgi:hypothetical protein
MLSVVMLSAIMLSVVMLGVVMLSIAAPSTIDSHFRPSLTFTARLEAYT